MEEVPEHLNIKVDLRENGNLSRVGAYRTREYAPTTLGGKLCNV